MGTTKTGRRIHTQPHTSDWVGSTDVCMYVHMAGRGGRDLCADRMACRQKRISPAREPLFAHSTSRLQDSTVLRKTT